MDIIKNDTYVLEFGKYKGKSIKQVMEVNPQYLKWADDNIPSFNLSKKLYQETINRKWQMLDYECDASEIDLY